MLETTGEEFRTKSCLSREDIGTFEKIDLSNFTVSERDKEKFADQRILAINT